MPSDYDKAFPPLNNRPLRHVPPTTTSNSTQRVIVDVIAVLGKTIE